MEKDDLQIKELIKEGFLKGAPKDFTDNVMQAVVKAQSNKQSAFDFSNVSFAAIILLTITLSVAVFYYFDKSFFQNTFGFIPRLIKQFIYSLTGIFEGSFNWGINFGTNGFIVGLVLIMASLLLFDFMINRKRKYMNLFV